MQNYDLIILGAGAAGLMAGLYGARAGLSTAILEHQLAGGQVNLTDVIDNLPSNPSMTGLELSGLLRKRAESFGASILQDKATSIDPASLVVSGESEAYQAKAIIFATGAEHRRLGIPGEERFSGKGVSYCSICDGAFFKGKRVLVIGGGNSALTSAIYLSKISDDVTVVHRRDELRAEKFVQDSTKKAGVKFLWNLLPQEFKGERNLESVLFKDKLTGELKEEPADGVFIYVGISPNTGLATAAGIELDDSGYIRVNRDQATSKRGIYAAGDVCGGVNQIVTAWGSGATAAMKAFEFITSGR